MKKDYLGNVLAVGDQVAFIERGYRNFVRGEITKLNDVKATIWIPPVVGYTEGKFAMREYSVIIKVNK